ncbi:MAG: ArnT family glycosyltransferase [Candidatus Scalinduaceae bacterium]
MLKSLSDISLLFLILLSKIVLQVFILRDGFIAVSGDDFLRTLISYEWSKEPFMASTSFGEVSATWMPLHFWIVGSLLKIYMDLWVIPALVSLIFSLLTLVMLYLIAQHLFNSKVGLITVLLAGFFPWEVWLSVSGTAATIYQFTIVTGIYYVLKWEGSKKSNSKILFLASLAFLASTMLRPGGWIFTVVFSSYLLYLIFTRSKSPTVYANNGNSKEKSTVTGGFKVLGGFTNWKKIEHKGFMTIAMILSWLFIGYWLYFNYTAYGDFLYFVKQSQQSYQMEAANLDSLAIRIFKYPVIMFFVSPIIFFLSVFSLVYFIRSWSKAGVARIYLFFILAGLLLLILGSVLGSGTRSTPQRYVILNLILFIPLVSYMFDNYLKRDGWKSIISVAIALILGLNIVLSFNYPTAYSDEAKVGRFLRDQWRERRLSEEEMVSAERTFQAYSNIPLTGYLERMYSLTNRWAMQVLSNHPENFVFSIIEDIDLDLNMNRRKIAEYFQKRKIKLITVKSEEAVKKIPKAFNFVGTVGGYMLFSDESDIFKGSIPSHLGKINYKIMKNFGNAVTLLGYNVDNGSFPRYISLYLKLLKKTEIDYRFSVKYIDTVEKNIHHSVITAPHYGAYNTSQWKTNEVIEERLYFPYKDELVPDEYILRLSLIDPYGEMVGKELDIGPFYVISSKRAVIKEFLTGGKRDPWLLFRVLITL